MNLHIVAFSAALCRVFLRAFQQRNVTHDHYRWVMPTSIAMTFVEYYLLLMVVHQGLSFSLLFAIGLGSGIGAVGAMYTHARFVGIKKPPIGGAGGTDAKD